MFFIVVLHLLEGEVQGDRNQRDDTASDGSEKGFGLFEVDAFCGGMLIDEVEAVRGFTDDVGMENLTDRMNLRQSGRDLGIIEDVGIVIGVLRGFGMRLFLDFETVGRNLVGDEFLMELRFR